ncbi:unnamed protein product [Adineta ricciae]|uniref:Uncharacterized protein n=1 Tax=Adineta ricciae TaxID=249248 RepID=A0A815UMY2_ADIRI|nr:unnamed protein product [Adineta ricciae]CAF1518257.1 unnamed protein product [Adineta ricciae]
MSTVGNIPSPSFCSKFKYYIVVDGSPLYINAVFLGYIIGVVIITAGFYELYRLYTYIVGKCQVKSIDMKFRDSKLHPRWNITSTYENKTINYSLIAADGFSYKDSAWSHAQKYQINHTYPCYRSKNDALLAWTWQWKLPSKFKVYGNIYGGVLLLMITTILILWRRRYRKIQQEQEAEAAASNFDRQQELQSMNYAETPPPAYNEVMQTMI